MCSLRCCSRSCYSEILWHGATHSTRERLHTIFSSLLLIRFYLSRGQRRYRKQKTTSVSFFPPKLTKKTCLISRTVIQGIKNILSLFYVIFVVSRREFLLYLYRHCISFTEIINGCKTEKQLYRTGIRTLFSTPATLATLSTSLLNPLCILLYRRLTYSLPFKLSHGLPQDS